MIDAYECLRMQRLERFGVGDWNDTELTEKTDLVRSLMGDRSRAGRPIITVVVPAHKEERYILATLLSLAEQAWDSAEIFVVSNGEPLGNKTMRIAEACGFNVLHDSKPGIARARQVGLYAASGEIIVTTDADTVHQKDWLGRIRMVMQDPRVVCGAGLFQSFSQRIMVRMMLAVSATTMRIKNAISPALLTGISEANSFYRREAALAVGGYDERIRVSEGMELFHRIRTKGMPVVFPDPGITVVTSGRRQEVQGAVRWFGIASWNAILHLLGREGVDDRTYPDIR